MADTPNITPDLINLPEVSEASSYRKLKLYHNLRWEFNELTDKLCYPILLPEELQAMLGDISTITLWQGGNILAKVDIKKYPRSVCGNMFFPFYADKYFNVYDNNANDLYLTASNTKNKYNYDVAVSSNPYVTQEEFFIRNWDGSFNVLDLCLGMYGMKFSD